MEIRNLTDTLSVIPGAVRTADLAALRDAGFRTILCNRPDGEAPDQPAWKELEEEATRLGLRSHFLPVVSGQVTLGQARQFDTLLAAAEQPVVAFCRTGTRSTTLWALAQAGRKPVAEIIATAGAAGYNLQGLAGRLAEAAVTP